MGLPEDNYPELEMDSDLPSEGRQDLSLTAGAWRNQLPGN